MKRFIEQFFSGERSSSQEKHFADSKMALTLVSLSLGVLLTSCQGENSVNSKEGLKLGVLAPITGDLASIGRNLPTAVQLAVDAINECGGVNEAEVTLITEDSQTDPRAGSEAMTELIEDEGVAGVVGAFTNSVSKAALDIAVDKQVMMISPGSTSSEFTEGAKNHEFDGFWARTAPSDIYQSQALATLARNQGFNEVATVVINNGYGIDFETEFVTDFKQAGGNVVGKAIRYDPQAASLANEAKAIFQGKPDAVLAVLYGQTGSSLLKSAFEEGYINDVTFLLTDRVYSENFIEQVGKTDQGKSLIAGALGIVPRANGQGLDQFQALWNQKTGEEITAYVPHNWDAAILMMLAAEASDANTGEGIKSKILEVANAPGTEVSDACQAMELIRNGSEINFQGASGNVDLDQNGDVVGSYDVWQVAEDGSLKTIDQLNSFGDN